MKNPTEPAGPPQYASCDDQEERLRALLAERGVVLPDIEIRRRTEPVGPLNLPIWDGPTTATVQVTMTVEVEPGADALEVAGRWLPYPRELPLSASDGRLLSVEVRRAGS